jgi:hypothetical protein
MFVQPGSELANLIGSQARDGLLDFGEGGHGGTVAERNPAARHDPLDRTTPQRPSGGQGRGGVARVKSLIVRVRFGL